MMNFKTLQKLVIAMYKELNDGSHQSKDEDDESNEVKSRVIEFIQ